MSLSNNLFTYILMKTKRYSSLMFIFSLLACWLIPSNCWASVEVDGIYYDLDSSTSTATVTSNSNEYSGDIVIPSSIDFEGNSYSVTSIGGSAFYECTGLISVTIPNCVTSIGTYAFRKCAGLTTVTIPNSVTSIGSFAFSECTGLISVTIPNSVTTISEYTFNGCSGITTVSIPNGVISIGSHAFYGCYNLTAVTIPNSVTSIGDYAFSACSNMTSIAIPNSVTRIGDGAFNRCSELTSVTIPNSVTSIAYATFSECSSLTSVDIPHSVTSIGSYAFQRCVSLTSVEIPNSVTSIGGEAFAKCESLTSLTVPFSVTTIGSFAFGECIGLTLITVDTGNINYDSRDNCNAIIEKSTNTLVSGCKNTIIPNSVTSIGDHAFQGCKGLTSVIIPNSVTSIGYSAFCDCNSLSAIMIDKEIPISIDRYTFRYVNNSTCTLYVPAGCKTAYQKASWWNDFKNIEEYDVDTDVLDTGSCGDNVSYTIFKDKSMVISGTGAMWPNSSPSYINDGYYKFIQRVIIEDGVTSIGYEAFKGCSGLTSVTIPNSVTSIGGNAFYFCSGLTSVTIPNSVTSIGWDAFFYCTSLTSIIVEGETPAAVGSLAFYNVDKSNCTLYVPTGSKSAYESASGWSEFENIVEIGNSLEILVTGSCGDDLTYTIYSDMSMVIIGSGPMWEYYDDTHINNDYYQSIEKVIIEEGVTSIGNCAFAECSGLSTVSIPNSVTEIGSGAFSGCTVLNSITIPNSVINIGRGAFYGCTDLISVEIPSSVTTIDGSAFSGCTGLTSVTIPNGVINIGWGAFDNCSGLTSVEISNSVASIEGAVFSGCTNLNSIVVSSGNSTYDSRDNCNAIIETSTNTLISGCQNTVIPNSVTSIGGSAFSDCTVLTSVTIPNSVTSIGRFAFSGCTGLLSVSIPNSVTVIDESAFEGCIGLASLTLGNNVTTIGEMAFTGCIGLSSVTIPNRVTNIDAEAFSGCTSLTSLIIGNSVTNIKIAAFYGCNNLTSIIVNSETPANLGNYESPLHRYVMIESVFEGVDKSNCILYVPYGSKSAYENAEGWGEFENIVEFGEEPDTDISALDNAIYVEQTEGRIGGTKDISVRMKSDYDVCAFQFTMTVPEGVTIKSWTISNKRLPSGASISPQGNISEDASTVNIACSLSRDYFTGRDGEIVTVRVEIGEDMEEGSYPIYLTNCHSNDFSTIDHPMSDVKASLVLEDYVVGDANGDGQVLVGDVTALLNYIVGRPISNFQEKAADVNGDGVILVGDVTGLLNIIVNQ